MSRKRSLTQAPWEKISGVVDSHGKRWKERNKIGRESAVISIDFPIWNHIIVGHLQLEDTSIQISYCQKCMQCFWKKTKTMTTPIFQHTGGYSRRTTLRFTGPQKDQCCLCNSYLKGNEAKGKELRENRHQKSWRCDDLNNNVKRWLNVTALCSLETSTFST